MLGAWAEEVPIRLKREDSDEAVILRVVGELTSRLAISGVIVKSLVWEGPGARLADQPVIGLGGKLFLRNELRNKLSPEEYRPLLASSMIYTWRFRTKRRLRALAVLAASLLVFAVLVWYLFQTLFKLLPPTTRFGSVGGLGGFLVFSLFGIILLLVYATGPYVRRLRLASDRIVSEEFGMGQALLRVLRKIDGFSVDPAGKAGILSGRLTVAQRIQNLSLLIEKPTPKDAAV